MHLKLSAKQIACSIAFSLFAAFALQSAYIVYNHFNLHKPEFFALFSRKTFVVLFLILLVFALAAAKYGKTIADFVYRYRYLIAGTVLVVCVFFELTGSSLQVWQQHLPDSNVSGPLMGTMRPIRSDEYSVNTPMALAQCFDPTGAFPYFSDTLRAAPTDMFIVYGQPVWNWAEIFRPFHWGYLLLGAEKGFSFFWVAREIALFMVTFELGMVILNKRKDLSLALAILLTFSSVVQWWFAINGLVEMLVFGQAAVLTAHFYMKTSSYKIRILLAAAFVICAGGYALTFYPAWQIPLFYVFLALFVWVVIANKKQMQFSAKKDVPLIAAALAVFAVCMALILFQSFDAINAVLHTDYPGTRNESGGGCLSNLFWYTSNLFTPSKDLFEHYSSLNQCEIACIFSFFPLGILLTLFVFLKEKQKDWLLILLMGVTVFLGLYLAVPWPQFLTKITLLSQAQTARVLQTGFGLANLLLLLRAAAVMQTKIKARYVVIFSVAFGAFAAWISKVTMYPMLENPTFLIAILLVIAVGSFLFIANRQAKKQLVLFCGLLGLFCGAIVNPVQKGMDVVLENPLYQEISEIAHKQAPADGVWIVEGDNSVLNNLPIMAGAPTINSTNTYPNLELFEQLDESGEYQSCYNRYAHIFIHLTDRPETTFSNPQADVCVVELSKNDLDILGPAYILSTKDLTQYSTDEQLISLYSQVDNYKIYQVEYQ